MNNKIVIVLVSVLLILFGITYSYFLKETVKIKDEKAQLRKDSLETEYYKKQLDSFPFEHSKIPDNGSN